MSVENNFKYIFEKRVTICFFIVILLFFSCILRVAVTATSDYKTVQKNQSSYRLTLGNLRGTIYDHNMIPLTNNKYHIIAAVSPTPRAVTGISGILSGDALANVLKQLKNGKPVLCEVPSDIDCDGIVCTKVFEHNSNDTPAIHLVGYTDIDTHGKSGLEKAYDKQLYSEKKAAIVYTVDGHGDILKGIKPEIENDTSVIAGGIVSTIDINIQNIAEKSALDIDTGAIVIAEANTGKIRAMVSRPSFDCTKIADYLKSANSPLLNRAISAFNVGSVFKPCVAATGIENGYSGFCYTCTGKCKIADRFFKCHKLDGHGFMTLKSALANSCNTYFYNFASKIGEENIYKTASSLGFGTSLNLCNGLSTSKGYLPTLTDLSNIAQLANFSIGQGSLLLSPVSMLTLYCSIASNGSYYVPSVTEGILHDGKLKPYDIGKPTKVMSSQTASMLREYLTSVLTEGTGKSATPKNVTAAGKTATAQTGKYTNGTEICEGWFCGFFPADNPKYVAIVFAQNNEKQTLSCGQIFSGLADEISSLSNNF